MLFWSETQNSLIVFKNVLDKIIIVHNTFAIFLKNLTTSG
jgi:hypothetical protein